MVPTVKEILEVLEKLAPSSQAEEWDNPGLQVGDPSQAVKKILVSLDPTLGAIKEAESRGADLLLTHHPLLFQPISQVNERSYPGNIIAEALKRRISILAAHTNLDRAEGGINAMLSHLLDLRNVTSLEEGGGGNPGLGRVGDLPEGPTLALLIQKIKKSLGITSVRASGPNEKIIRRVAVVGGAGGSLVGAALAAGADLLITGDIKHHDALLAKDLGLALVDAGHYETEKPALDLFAERLRKTFGGEGWAVSIETDGREEPPMKYE